jgi:hypothetical protein
MTSQFSRNTPAVFRAVRDIFIVQAESAALRSFHKQKGAQSLRDRAGFDMTDMTPLTAGLCVDDMGAGTPIAIAPGTTVLTLAGALPIEHLYPGDKLITRHGARALQAIDRVTLPAGMAIVELTKNALGGRPDQDLWLPAAQRVLIRDWRAKALYGQAQACVPVGQLADGEFIRLGALTQEVTGFALRFGRPEVFYANGLELASADELTVLA